jgi:hypothetical protein
MTAEQRARVKGAAVVSVAVALAGSACTAIVGVSDITFTDAGASGTTPGEGGADSEQTTDAHSGAGDSGSKDGKSSVETSMDVVETSMDVVETSTDAAEDTVSAEDASDSATCGGSVCSGGQTCQSGTCQCPPDEDFCSNQCVSVTANSENCGRCGHSCFGGVCSASTCGPVVFVTATLTSSIVDIASDGTVVVWADVGDNTIDQVSTAGGSKLVLASPSTAGLAVSGPRNIAMAANGTVSWFQYGTQSELGFAMRGVANADDTDEEGTIAGITTGLVTTELGASNTGVYTVRDVSGSGAQAISCEIGGGCGTDGVLIASSTQTSFTVGIDPDLGLVFSDVTNSVVYAGLSTVVTGQSEAHYVTDDGTYTYWSTSTGAVYPISRVLMGGSTVQTVLANATGPVAGIATDGINVYFTAGTSIDYVPVGGGSATVLANYAAAHLKYVASAVYFDVAGAIYKVATP